VGGIWVTSRTCPRRRRRVDLVDAEASGAANQRLRLPARSRPMLPEALSNNACSLVPGSGVDRLGAVTVEDADRARPGHEQRVSSLVIPLLTSGSDYDRGGFDRIFRGAENVPPRALGAKRSPAGTRGQRRARRPRGPRGLRFVVGVLRARSSPSDFRRPMLSAPRMSRPNGTRAHRLIEQS